MSSSLPVYREQPTDIDYTQNDPCTKCKHQRGGVWFLRLFFNPICLAHEDISPQYDPVTGKRSPAQYLFCTSLRGPVAVTRYGYGPCPKFEAKKQSKQ